MKKFPIFSFILLMIPVVASANYCKTHFPDSIKACEKSLEEDKDVTISGNWLIRTQTSDDGTDHTIAVNWSSYNTVDVVGKEVPSLSLWCNGREAQASLFMATGVHVDSKVTYTFAGNPSINEEWKGSYMSISPVNHEPFTSRLFDGENLVIMTDSFLSQPMAVKFDMEGIDGVARKLECLAGK